MITSYQTIRERIKTGDILEWQSKSIIGSAIRFITKQEVNHTSLCIDLQQYLHWLEPHKFVLEANAPGIELNLISRELGEYKGGHCWWYKLKDIYNDKRNYIANSALLQVGKKYDYNSLFKNIISRANAEANNYFCSEFAFIELVKENIISGLHFNYTKQIVLDIKDEPVKAPRPGEFGQFGIFENPIQII